MRSLRIVSALSLLGAILVVGCGKSDSNDTLNLSSFTAEAADIYCSAMVDCSCTDAAAFQDCKTAYRATMTEILSMRLIEYPGSKLDPVAARTCLNDARAELSDCTYSPPPDIRTVTGLASYRSEEDLLPASCEEILVGGQAVGERCVADLECAPGLACDWRDYTCAPRTPVEESCEYVSCEEGLFCGQMYLCADRPGAGEACRDVPCEDGLSCRFVPSAMQDQCVAPHALGAGCSDDAGCVEGTYCDWDDTVTCLARLEDGETCDYSDQCLHGWCNEFDSTCGNPGICSLLTGNR